MSPDETRKYDRLDARIMAQDTRLSKAETDNVRLTVEMELLKENVKEVKDSVGKLRDAFSGLSLKIAFIVGGLQSVFTIIVPIVTKKMGG